MIMLTNCSVPGTALLGPAFTGATTKSVARASFSFGSNQIVKKINETSKKSKKQFIKVVKKLDEFQIQARDNHLLNFNN